MKGWQNDDFLPLFLSLIILQDHRCRDNWKVSPDPVPFRRERERERGEKVSAISRNYCSVLRVGTVRILPFKACGGNLETGGLSNNSVRQKDSLRFIKSLENLPVD